MLAGSGTTMVAATVVNAKVARRRLLIFSPFAGVCTYSVGNPSGL